MTVVDDGKTAFGLTGAQVSYVIHKLNLKGCDYVAGVFYAPVEYHDRIYDLVKSYSQLKLDVAAWENMEKP